MVRPDWESNAIAGQDREAGATGGFRSVHSHTGPAFDGGAKMGVIRRRNTRKAIDRRSLRLEAMAIRSHPGPRHGPACPLGSLDNIVPRVKNCSTVSESSSRQY